MKFNKQLLDELTKLVVLSLESGLNTENQLRLEELLEKEPLARKYYFRLINIHLGVLDPNILKVLHGQNQKIPNDIELWKALTDNKNKQDSCQGVQDVTDSNTSLRGADLDTFDLDADSEGSEECGFTQDMLELLELERTSPAIEITKEEPKRELIQKVVYPPREKREISKFQIFTLMMSAAAMLFVVLFVKFVPRQYSIEVATLVDQINVKWADSATNLNNGDRLWTNREPIGLAKGVVKIQYDDGVEVLVEGPAVFELERSGIFLDYGRLYSRVSETGCGFRVDTPTSRFVDLGTEFGVQADIEGSTQLHVIKGKVLFAGLLGDSKARQSVTENEAVQYHADSGRVDAISVQKDAFVREVDSTKGLIWRGQAHVNLADIVGGGNGFGTGKMNWGIDTRTGKIEMHGSSNLSYTYHSNPVYRRCPSPLIDGVFVPDAGEGPVQISSTGLNFAECPDTTGDSADIIQNGSFFTGYQMSSEKAPDHHLGLDGRTLQKPGECLYMHSNKGITFDLEAIRRTIPGLRINRFKAIAGLSDTVLELTETFPRADFWVLVDGRLKVKQIGVTPEDRAFDINIPLTDTDRFLTLIITDSGPMTRDWGVFANPVLELELK